MTALLRQWQALSARYAALSERERIVVALAVVLVVGMGGHSVWVDPADRKARSLTRQIEQQRQDAAALQVQLAALREAIADPDAARRQALAEVNAQTAQIEGTLQQFESQLVPPQRMPQLLQSLLSRHRGVELLGLSTLDPAPLIDRTKPAEGRPAGSRPAAAPDQDNVRNNVFRHGIEIRLAGSYADLLAYVAELERSPQKLSLGKMTLVAKEYPRNELRLTVHTLSRAAVWLEI